MKSLRTVLVALVLLASAVSAFAWGEKATGEITSILYDSDGSPLVNATVEGTTRDGKLWLTLSYMCNDGGGGVLMAREVKRSFSNVFPMGRCSQGYSVIRSCLWEENIYGMVKGEVVCRDY